MKILFFCPAAKSSADTQNAPEHNWAKIMNIRTPSIDDNHEHRLAYK